VLLTGTLSGYGAEGVAGGAPVEVRAADGPEGAPPLDLAWAPEETWRYSIELPPGRYRLTARHRDRVGEVLVDLTDGQAKSADITLHVDGKEGAR
jgi:hypothetical protein